MKASAPGKLFLVGEYVVLEGGPAVLTPVPQRARVTIKPSVAAKSLVTSHGARVESFPLAQAVRQLPLLAAVLDTLECRDALLSMDLTLDTSEFFRDGVKLGLGSSAALTAALTNLLSGDRSSETRLRQALACHHAFQAGIGSGADVALSVMDQPILFCQAESPREILLPEDLHLLAIWAGSPASTTDFVSRMAGYGETNPLNYTRHMDKLRETAESCVRFIETTNTNQVLATITQYDRQLELLSIDSGVNFYNLPHQAMRKKVELRRCAYKPSGAGGGDFGIAYSADRRELAGLAEQLDREQIYNFVLG